MYPIASEETYEDGQVIFKEGSSGDWVYVVLSGSVEISKTIGERKTTLAVLEPGEVFGEGEQFLLKLQLPELSEPMEINCESVWTREQSETEKRPPGMGVKFCEMAERDSQILNHYIQTLSGG